MTLQDKILEIIDKNCDKDGYCYDNAAKEISDHIKEFIEWMTTDCYGSFTPKDYESDISLSDRFNHKWYMDIPNNLKEYTLDELYTYWLTQIKGK